MKYNSKNQRKYVSQLQRYDSNKEPKWQEKLLNLQKY